MREPLPPKVCPRTAAGGPSPEVARVKSLYLETLRRRIEDGSYLTEERIRVAMDRMLRAVEDDLPAE